MPAWRRSSRRSASGIVPAALEYLDHRAVAITRGSFPIDIPPGDLFAVIAEADGTSDEAEAGREALVDAMKPGSVQLDAPVDPADVQALWRWRDGVGLAADAALGGKVSEDIGVPVDKLATAIERTHQIGASHGLATCSWGHAGDGNLHSSFLFDPDDTTASERTRRAADELFAVAAELGGTISGEHGVGLAKAGQLARQWAPEALALHEGVKQLFDPAGLLNPGKKEAR